MQMFDLKETRNLIEVRYLASHLDMGKVERSIFQSLMQFLDDFIGEVEKRENETAK
jgi:hypothetical protein